MRKKLFTLLMLSIFSNLAFSQDFVDYEKAYTAFENGEMEESYIYLKRSLKDSPEHLPSKILMAEILALSGYYLDALSEFEESLASGADANLIVESYIRVLMVLGDHGRVLDIPETQLTPMKHGFLLSAKANTYMIREDFTAALSYFEKALKVAPTSTVVLNTAADYYLSVKDFDQAKSLLDRSLTINNKISATYDALARYYGSVGDKQNQITALKNGLAIADYHPNILRELVSVYSSNEEYEEARQVLQKTLKTTPDDPMASLLLSWVESRLGDSESSKNTLTDLVNSLSLLDSSNLAQQDYIQFVSAMANYAAGNLTIARGLLEQYTTKNPTHFESAKLLANIYQQEKSYLAAANTLERFEDEVNADLPLVVALCKIYMDAKQNHKCNTLLEQNRQQYGSEILFIQAESSLLAARGKLNLAIDNLASSGSNDLSVRAQQSVLAIRSNKLDEATTLVDSLLAERPNSLDFLNLKASILKQQAKVFEAEEVYLSILSIDPNHYAANFNLAHIYYITNSTSDAKSRVQTLLEQKPNNTDLLLLEARILIKMKEFEGAFASISKAEALLRGSIETDEAYISLYIATEELDKALHRINKLLKNDITNTQYLQQRARIYHMLGNETNAQKDLRVLYGLRSDDSQALFQLSNTQGEYDDLQGAMQSLKRADSITPNNLFINRNIAKLALTMGDRMLAAEKLEWLINTSPNNPDILLLQGDFKLSEGDKIDAARYYQKAVRVDPGLTPALIASYQLAKEGFETKGFVAIFESLATDPAKHVFATHLLADYFYSKQYLVEAKTAYISISSKTDYAPLPMVLNNLANIYITEDKVDAAYNFAQQAYEMVQKNSAILDTIGWISVLRGDYDQGLSLLRQAYSMNAQDPNLRYHLAFALNRLGRTSESKRELSILLSDFPDFTKRTEALALQRSIL